VSGGFINGKVMTQIVDIDCKSNEEIETWRKLSIDLILSVVRKKRANGKKEPPQRRKRDSAGNCDAWLENTAREMSSSITTPTRE
jgi:hypothetical protein